MKVYYEEFASVSEVEKAVEASKGQIPGSLPDEVKNIIETLSNLSLSFYTKYMNEVMEKYKYKLMWDLRHLEEEIYAENGNFVITSSGGLKMNGFSDDLMARIKQQIEPGKK